MKTIVSVPVLASLTVSTLTSVTVADVTIDRIVPEDAVFVITAPNVNAMMQRLEKTPLYPMFQNEEMAALWKNAVDDAGAQFTDWLADIGMDEDDVNWPQGAAGIAVFLVMNEDLGVNQPALMVYGDWGDHADKTSELIRAALDEGAKSGEIEFEESDLLGRNVISIDLSDDDADDDEEFDHFGEMPMGGPMDMFSDFDRMHLVREGTSFIICSNLDAIADALERMEGRAGRRSLAEHDVYRGVISQLGEHDVSAVLLTANVGRLLASDPDMMMVNMMTPMLGAAFGNVQAFGMSYKVGTAGEEGFSAGRPMVETSIGVYMPTGKRGLTSLLDVRRERRDVPAFVSGQTSSYGVMHLNFDRIVDEMTNVIRSIPMLAMQMEEMLTEVGPVLDEIFATLGPRIHTLSVVEQPVRVGGSNAIWAIECRDTQRFENAIAGFAPQMGLEPRDFLGHRIYTTPPGFFDAMMPMGPGRAEPVDEEPMSMSLGIGGGYVVLGASRGVENIMRLVGETGRSAFSEDEKFSRTSRSLPANDVLSWGYSDLPVVMKQMFVDQAAQMEQMIADMDAWADDGAFGGEDDWLKDMRRDWEQSIETSRVMSEVLPKHLGPMTYVWQSTDSGFVGRYFLYPPDDRN